MSWEIKGLRELEKKLSNLEKKVGKKIVRKAVKEAQKITLQAAKENSKAMVGGEMGTAMAKALKTKAEYKQKKGSYQMQLLIDPKKAEEFVSNTKDGIRYYIPTAIEYGHRKRGGGTVPAIPFMRKASDSTTTKKIDKFISEIKKGIEKET